MKLHNHRGPSLQQFLRLTTPPLLIRIYYMMNFTLQFQIHQHTSASGVPIQPQARDAKLLEPFAAPVPQPQEEGYSHLSAPSRLRSSSPRRPPTGHKPDTSVFLQLSSLSSFPFQPSPHQVPSGLSSTGEATGQPDCRKHRAVTVHTIP